MTKLLWRADLWTYSLPLLNFSHTKSCLIDRLPTTTSESCQIKKNHKIRIFKACVRHKKLFSFTRNITFVFCTEPLSSTESSMKLYTSNNFSAYSKFSQHLELLIILRKRSLSLTLDKQDCVTNMPMPMTSVKPCYSFYAQNKISLQTWINCLSLWPLTL